jgi:hypothetical protein
MGKETSQVLLRLNDGRTFALKLLFYPLEASSCSPNTAFLALTRAPLPLPLLLLAIPCTLTVVREDGGGPQQPCRQLRRVHQQKHLRRVYVLEADAISEIRRQDCTRSTELSTALAGQ